VSVNIVAGVVRSPYAVWDVANIFIDTNFSRQPAMLRGRFAAGRFSSFGAREKLPACCSPDLTHRVAP